MLFYCQNAIISLISFFDFDPDVFLTDSLYKRPDPSRTPSRLEKRHTFLQECLEEKRQCRSSVKCNIKPPSFTQKKIIPTIPQSAITLVL